MDTPITHADSITMPAAEFNRLLEERDSWRRSAVVLMRALPLSDLRIHAVFDMHAPELALLLTLEEKRAIAAEFARPTYDGVTTHPEFGKPAVKA